MRRRLLGIAFTACLIVVLAPAAAAARWQPQPTTSPWQWQLQGKADLSVRAPVYELDGFQTSAATVERLHSMGRRVICYIDVGSWERFRPDADRFPRQTLGQRYEGYPDERWLDIRRIGKLAAPLTARIRMCARKGFDAVEPDNLEGFRNPTGFPLTARDQLKFNRWIARRVHHFDLAVALKNDGSQAKRLARDFDFAVVEQCFQYSECGPYRAFIRAGKPVFVAEYEIPPRRFCTRAKRMRFSAIAKDYDLRARPWRPCPGAGSARRQAGREAE